MGRGTCLTGFDVSCIGIPFQLLDLDTCHVTLLVGVILRLFFVGKALLLDLSLGGSHADNLAGLWPLPHHLLRDRPTLNFKPFHFLRGRVRGWRHETNFLIFVHHMRNWRAEIELELLSGALVIELIQILPFLLQVLIKVVLILNFMIEFLFGCQLSWTLQSWRAFIH